MDVGKLYNNYQEIIQSNNNLLYRDYLLAKAKVKDSTAYYQGNPIDFLYQPLFFSKRELERFKKLSSSLNQILKKVTKQYLNDAEFRSHFKFPELMEELILVDPGYPQIFPMARFDVFFPYNSPAKFCELNADGSSAMNEVRVLQDVIKDTKAFKMLEEYYHLQGFELFYSWIKVLMENYAIFTNNGKNRPGIAIVDFKGEGTINEFKEFAKRLNSLDYPTVICDPRELRYVSGRLYYQHQQIYLIYRRATTIRIIEEANDLQDFLQAYREGAVCVVGGLCSQIIHNKIIFAILHNERATSFLDKRDRDFIKLHIPNTMVMDVSQQHIVNKAITAKNKYILKPFDKAASKGVYVGRDYSINEWRQIIETIAEQDYLLQEFVEVPQLKMATVDHQLEQLTFEKYGYLIGMFLYNQELKGLYTRAGRKNIIGAVAEAYTVPNFIVERCEGQERIYE